MHGGFGWLVTPISWGLIGFIWLYNLVRLFVIDLLKIGIYRQFDEQETGQVTWETWFRPLDPQHGRSANIVRKDSRFTPDSVRVLSVVLAQCAVRQA